MSDERAKALMWHLREAADTDLPSSSQRRISYWDSQTANILAFPQARVDALVAAGVLAPSTIMYNTSTARAAGMMTGPGYRVVQPKPPHVHDYATVEALLPGLGNRPCEVLKLRCDCGFSIRVPNKLPIEVPE